MNVDLLQKVITIINQFHDVKTKLTHNIWMNMINIIYISILVRQESGLNPYKLTCKYLFIASLDKD